MAFHYVYLEKITYRTVEVGAGNEGEAMAAWSMGRPVSETDGDWRPVSAELTEETDGG